MFAVVCSDFDLRVWKKHNVCVRLHAVQLTGLFPLLGSNPRPSDHESGALPCCHRRGTVYLNLQWFCSRSLTVNDIKHKPAYRGGCINNLFCYIDIINIYYFAACIFVSQEISI